MNVKKGFHINKRFIVLILIPVFIFCACSNPNPNLNKAAGSDALSDPIDPGDSDGSGEPGVIVDQIGRTVEINDPVERIVSGYYISTSACIALGLKSKMVGIEARAASRPIYAVAAPELLELPSVGSAKEFNLEACIALEPGLVILPGHMQDNADIITKLGIPVILVNPESYDGFLDMIALIGNAAGVCNKAERLLNYYNDKRSVIDKLTAELVNRPVVYMGGVGSYLTTAPNGMYQSALIDIAGGQNAACEIMGNGWTQISYEQLLAMDPEVIVIPSEAAYDKADILNDPQLTALTAVREGNIYHMPGDFEAWDSPVSSSILGILWLFNVLHGDFYTLETLNSDASNFYNDFYGIHLNAYFSVK